MRRDDLKLEKGTVRTLALVLFGAILFYWALDHWDLLWDAVRLCARLMFPFFLGFCIAFVLNVPMRALEKKFWPQTDKKALNALRRPTCILVSLVLILAILTAVVMLVVPELVNAFGVPGRPGACFPEKCAGMASGERRRLPCPAGLAVFRADRLERHRQNAVWLCDHRRGQYSGRHRTCSDGHCGRHHQHHHRLHFCFVYSAWQGKIQTPAYCAGAGLPAPAHVRRAGHVGKVAARTFAKFVSGQCIEACILGTLCWLGMLLFRFPYAPMVGALVGISALVPIVGALVGTVVGAFMIMMVDPILAVWFVVFLLVLQQIEGNVIYPRVVGSSVGLPPVWVLAAVTLGGSLYGIAGMLFGVPTASVAYTLVKEAAARRLAAKAAASAGTPAPLPVPQAAHGEAPAEGRQPAPPEKPAAKRARQTKKNGAGAGPGPVTYAP